jgi:hypothetical protein
MALAARSLLVTFLISLLAACGGGSGSTSSSNETVPPPVPPVLPPSAQHIVVVVLENQDYADVVGSPFMPFLNTLATQNALATQFYSNAHPSIGDYMMMTAGTNTTGDLDTWTGTWPGDNVVRQLTAAGKTWKVYAESLPSIGYTGGDTSDQYIRHHNPFVYLDDVLNSTNQLANVVPFTQFSLDLAANALPSYSFIVPNNSDNGHDCPMGAITCPISDHLTLADTWLSNNLPALLQNNTMMANTVVIVTFDESNTDNTNGGGRIAAVFAGPLIKSGFQSTTMYQFPSLLRFSLESLGVTSLPNQAASAPSMGEFLK